MEAKTWQDTVMDDEAIGQAIKEAISKQGWLNITVKQRNEAIAQAQAAISYKAGIDEEAKKCIERCALTYQAGIREVVELIDKTGLIEHTDSPLHEIGATILDCPACCWYVYKKEWGL